MRSFQPYRTQDANICVVPYSHVKHWILLPFVDGMVPPRRKKLSYGRPHTMSNGCNLATPSARRGRSLIRNFHRLSKARAASLRSNDATLAKKLKSEIEAQGGLERYQAASIAGQFPQRGGDSSKALIEWIKRRNPENHGRLRMLEIGSLSANNQCSRSGLFDVTRIDLNAQGRGIVQQDFMQRPLPKSDNERFDCISLSLVLNYEPDSLARGDMLQRVACFLRQPQKLDTAEQADPQFAFPSLFLVLPAACVLNSRYLDERRLEKIMNILGYDLLEWKISAKLSYQLWRYGGRGILEEDAAKREINPGKGRNNFAIVLR